jgi:hypothetical protein
MEIPLKLLHGDQIVYIQAVRGNGDRNEIWLRL